MRRLTVPFFGEVQGVGFRREAQITARELKINGSIQNCQDGSVKAIIQGDMSAIFSLIEHLACNFSLTSIKTTFESSIKGLQDFLILDR